jgi:hypothetical protein
MLKTVIDICICTCASLCAVFYLCSTSSLNLEGRMLVTPLVIITWLLYIFNLFI